MFWKRGVVWVNIEAFYAQILSVPPEMLDPRLLEHTEQCKVKKGTILFQAGEVQGKLMFLMSGIVRGFLLDVNGRDITDCFVFRSGMPVMASFELGERAPISVEALTDCELVCLPVSLVQELVERDVAYTLVYVRLLCAAVRAHWEMKAMLYQGSAKERYRWFLSTYPGLIDQVKHKHIASFLGMSPVTLSRLRGEGRGAAKP